MDGETLSYYQIRYSSPVIFKNSSSSAKPGNFSQVTLTGIKLSGSEETQEGYITITEGNDIESEVAVATPYTTSIQDSSPCSYITIRLYPTPDSSKDELASITLPVIFSGADGITFVCTNSVHAIPTDSGGQNGNYSGSGTLIKVYEGATELQYDGLGRVMALGRWGYPLMG